MEWGIYPHSGIIPHIFEIPALCRLLAGVFTADLGIQPIIHIDI